MYGAAAGGAQLENICSVSVTSIDSLHTSLAKRLAYQILTNGQPAAGEVWCEKKRASSLTRVYQRDKRTNTWRAVMRQLSAVKEDTQPYSGSERKIRAV